MKVWVYSIMFNEAPMLPYFLRHYQTFADKIVLFDDHSTDGSSAIARAAGAEVRPYPGQGLDDIEFVDFAARTYPEARGQADWVFWPDADELVYHPHLRERLAAYQAQGVTLPALAGYAMFSETFPTTREQIYDEVCQGVPYAPECKPIVFDPRLSIQWIAGKHGLEGQGWSTPSSEAEIKLLHYRHLGERWFVGRNQRNYARLSERNIAARMGWQVYPDQQPGVWERERSWIVPKLERVVPAPEFASSSSLERGPV